MARAMLASAQTCEARTAATGPTRRPERAHALNMLLAVTCVDGRGWALAEEGRVPANAAGVRDHQVGDGLVGRARPRAKWSTAVWLWNG
jgi:hypothetical protein